MGELALQLFKQEHFLFSTILPSSLGTRLTARNFSKLSDIRWRHTGLPRCRDLFLWTPWFWGRTAKREPRTARRCFLTPCIRLILSTVSPPAPATLERRACCAFARCASHPSYTRRLQGYRSSRLPFQPSAPSTVTPRYPDSTPLPAVWTSTAVRGYTKPHIRFQIHDSSTAYP